MSGISLERTIKGMLFMATTPETEAKVVKRALYDGMRSNGVKQEIIATVLDVNQSSVSRMTNPNEDLHLSVSHLSLLRKDPFTAPVADEIIQAIGGRFNLTEAKTDGDMLDELLELTEIDGKLANILRDGVQPAEHGKVLKLADRLEDIAIRLRTEVAEAKKKIA